jgi:hypothetical protein
MLESLEEIAVLGERLTQCLEQMTVHGQENVAVSRRTHLQGFAPETSIQNYFRTLALGDITICHLAPVDPGAEPVYKPNGMPGEMLPLPSLVRHPIDDSRGQDGLPHLIDKVLRSHVLIGHRDRLATRVDRGVLVVPVRGLDGSTRNQAHPESRKHQPC